MYDKWEDDHPADYTHTHILYPPFFAVLLHISSPVTLVLLIVLHLTFISFVNFLPSLCRLIFQM